jgi:predicted AAA+ superfamily ATPase
MSNYRRSFVGELQRRLEQSLPFIQAVVGPRQVGKTTGVLQLQQQISLPFHYASADSPAPPGYTWIEEQWMTARAMAGPSGAVLVLDEIQKVQAWSQAVKKLFDEERGLANNKNMAGGLPAKRGPLRVVILGSASWNLQAGLTETLAGRFELLPVHHWSYRECQQVYGWNLDTFLKFGGYPAAAHLIDEVSRWQSFMQDAIIEPMLSRDLLSIREVQKPALFRQTLRLALSYPAQEISLQKLLGQLQRGGNTTTIKGYLELLEAGFVLKVLGKYSTRPLSRKTSSPKLVPLAPALVQTFAGQRQYDDSPQWQGRVFEAAIGAALLQSGVPVHYWRDGNVEVDYVLEWDDRLIAIEVRHGSQRSAFGLDAFKKHFPRAVCLTVNNQIGQQLLSEENPLELLGRMIDHLIPEP